MKKITLITLFCCFLVSCGKKNDPEYKVSKQNTKMQTILINKI